MATDQRYACTASADGKVYIYDVASTQLVRVYDPTGGNETTGSCTFTSSRPFVLTALPFLSCLI